MKKEIQGKRLRKYTSVLFAAILAISLMACENRRNQADKTIENAYGNVQTRDGKKEETKEDGFDKNEKKVLRMFSAVAADEIKDRIKQFNENNEDYEIELISYGMDNPNRAVTELNYALANGEIPDILYITGGMYIDQYVKAGMIADLYPWMDQDEEISRDDFFEPVLKAAEVDGRLYFLESSFGIDCLLGNKSMMETTDALTFSDMQKYYDGVKKSWFFEKYITKENFISDYLGNQWGRYINTFTGESNLETKYIEELLEFSKSLPDDEEDIYCVGKYAGKTTEDLLRDKELMLQPVRIWTTSSFSFY